MLFRFFTRSLSCKYMNVLLSPVLSLDASLTACFRLLFMTYNGWIMLAVAVGAFVGYLAFSNASATKSAACH